MTGFRHYLLPLPAGTNTPRIEPFAPAADAHDGWHRTDGLWTESAFRESHPWQVRQCAGTASNLIGLQDEVAITVEWRTDTLYDAMGQVGPAMMFHTGPDDLSLGFGPVWDIGLAGGCYYLGVFDAPHAELLASNCPAPVWRYHHRLQLFAEPFNAAQDVFERDVQEITMFVTPDTICCVWNGKLVDHQPRPEWTQRLFYPGARAIDIKPPPGYKAYDFDADDWTGTDDVPVPPTDTHIRMKVDR